MKSFLLFTVFSIFGFTNTTLNQTNIKANLPALGIPTEKLKTLDSLNKNQTNIAFFGVDRRNTSDFGNSDIIMIISIDSQTKKIKLSSIMRDTYVTIYARGKNKINAAYLEGGPQLAVRTLNENFDMTIQDYISVDFFGSAKIFQALGGVEINVKQEELEFMNNYLGEIAGIDKVPAKPLTKPGLQLLDGKQVIAYSRIRAVGNGDYARIQRQKTVMQALLSNLQNKKKEDLIPIILTDVLPNIETSLNYADLFKIGTTIMDSKSKTFEHARFPLDKASKGVIIDKIWYLSTDLQSTTKSLHDFIYKDIYP